MVEFKRGVYEMALTELSRYLPRGAVRNHRYTRIEGTGEMQVREPRMSYAPTRHLNGSSMELPPGASYDPRPPSQT